MADRKSPPSTRVREMSPILMRAFVFGRDPDAIDFTWGSPRALMHFHLHWKRQMLLWARRLPVIQQEMHTSPWQEA